MHSHDIPHNSTLPTKEYNPFKAMVTTNQFMVLSLYFIEHWWAIDGWRRIISGQLVSEMSGKIKKWMKYNPMGLESLKFEENNVVILGL